MARPSPAQLYRSLNPTSPSLALPPTLPGEHGAPGGLNVTPAPNTPSTVPGEHGTSGGVNYGTGAGTISIHGAHPDYANLLNSYDPYQRLLDALNQSNLNLGQGRRSTVRSKVAQSGLSVSDLGGFTDSYGDLDPTTFAAGQAATDQGVSDTAQLGHSKAQALDNLHALMASRGLLSSGMTGLQEGDIDTQYKIGRNNLIQSLLSAFGQAQNDYAQGVAGNMQSKAQGMQTAMDSLTKSYPTSNDVTATLDTKTNLYKDPYGNLYDANGNLIHTLGTY